MKQAGKVCEFGVSNFTVDQLNHLQAACPMKLVCNQIEISLLRHDALNNGSLDHYRRNNITPLAWSPLAQGKLGSKYPISLPNPNQSQEQALRDALQIADRPKESTRTAAPPARPSTHPAGSVPIILSPNPHTIPDTN